MKKQLLTLLFAIISVISFSQVPSYVPTNGLVGYWPFNGNANDESGNGNNGTVNGATLTADRFGIPNSAFNFEGLDNYIDILNLNSNKINSDFTISTWINFKTFNSLYPQIINGDNNFVAIHLGGSGYLNNTAMYKKLIFYYSPGPNYTISDNVLNTNNYYFVTTVKNLNQIYLYINGVKQITSNINNANIASGNYIRIGSYAPSVENDYNRGDFDGQIDDIGVWNRALDSSEISNLYNGNVCYQYITVTDTLIINTNLTGFNPVNYQNTIKIWPNPTNDHITIDYGNYANLNGYQLKINNSVGQQMFQTNIVQQTSYVDLGTWSGNGIYFVHLIDPQGNTVDIRKIVLQ